MLQRDTKQLIYVLKSLYQIQVVHVLGKMKRVIILFD